MEDITQYHSCKYLLEWHGCYDKDCKYDDYVTEASFAHPAKMSFGLLQHIFKHLQEMSLVTPDTTIIDFMAGTFRTGIMAELFGYRSIGVELEPHFIEMIEGNKAQIEKRTGRHTQMQFIQGDARQLSSLLNETGYCGVVSPPYGEAINKNAGGPIGLNRIGISCKMARQYSANEENIGNLPDKPILMGIVSPPYQDTAMPMGCPSHIRKLAREENWETAIELEKQAEAIQVSKGNKFSVSSDGAIRRKIEQALEREKGNYSEDDANIGNLSDRKPVGITSPPYENRLRNEDRELHGRIMQTYLSEMLKVYSEAFRCRISPLVLVTKNPTRNGALRRLDLDTIFLLQKSGYEIFDYHRAILFEEHTQETLDGATFKKTKGRLSFFKRLSYQKGNAVARWEDVIFARIPDASSDLARITSPPYAEAQTGGGIAIDGYRGKHINEMGKNQPDKVGDRCGYMKAWHGMNPANTGNLPDRER